MPIIVQSGQGSGSSIAATTPASAILECVSQDVRRVLNPTGGVGQYADQALLLDYTNRISLQMLRYTNWTFLNSTPQLFLTSPGVTDYWIGAVGTGPTGTVDTGLNLSNVQRIRRDAVFNRTANTSQSMAQTDNPPLSFTLQLAQQPLFWRNDPTSPYVLNIYPPPNAPAVGSSVSQVVAPKGPVATQATSGALPARTYYVKTTFVDSGGGESQGSVEQVFFVPAGQLITIKSPIIELSGATGIISLTAASGITINKWNCYIQQLSGNTVLSNPVGNSETLQNGSPIALGTDFTEPGTGLINTGPGVPGTPTLAPLNGYLIDFRYFLQRQAISSTTAILQIPDVYKDIVCAGVNWLAYKYLKKDDEAQVWMSIYQRGLIEMIKDMNLHPRDGEFIRPDPYTVVRSINTGVGLDSGLETSIP